jgi:hypothetical protein
MKDTEHTSLTKNDSLEKRIKALEEDLHILKEKLSVLIENYDSASSPSGPSGSTPLPDSMDKDEWYTNHGHGD